MGPARLPTISTVDLHRRLGTGDGLWLVYVPDRASFGDAHIPGSLTLPDPASTAALARGEVVVVYGEDGTVERAPRTVRALLGTGADARWFAGGLSAWAAAGHPIEGRDR
jgi:rhodanese-related sulfurtransferase